MLNDTVKDSYRDKNTMYTIIGKFVNFDAVLVEALLVINTFCARIGCVHNTYVKPFCSINAGTYEFRTIFYDEYMCETGATYGMGKSLYEAMLDWAKNIDVYITANSINEALELQSLNK